MSNDMLGEASLDGHFTRLNGAWTETLGYSQEELMAEPYVNHVHPDDLESTYAVAGALAQGPSRVVDFENRYRTKDGDWRWLWWSARSDGERIYAIAKDITERKALEADRDALLAKVSEMAQTDDLTGLPNRRSWDDALEREVSRAARTGRQLAVVMLDIDHFKAFNDEHGHQVGDEMLREAAAAWKATLRGSDFIARYGGEEFGVLLPETTIDGAQEVVERLRAATPMGQSCSAGVAFWEPTELPEQVVGRADLALYESKRAGRDRLTVAIA